MSWCSLCSKRLRASRPLCPCALVPPPMTLDRRLPHSVFSQHADNRVRTNHVLSPLRMIFNSSCLSTKSIDCNPTGSELWLSFFCHRFFFQSLNCHFEFKWLCSSSSFSCFTFITNLNHHTQVGFLLTVGLEFCAANCAIHLSPLSITHTSVTSFIHPTVHPPTYSPIYRIIHLKDLINTDRDRHTYMRTCDCVLVL